MSTPELIKKDPRPSCTISEASAKVEDAKDGKRELADAEVGAIRGGQNSHNPPPTNPITP